MWMAITGILVFLADIATKWLATHYLSHALFQRVEVVPGCLDFFLRYNPGGAFSLFDEYPALITGFSLVAVIWIFLWGRKISRGVLSAQLAFGMILGGAVGNLVERILFRQVTDFIHVYYKSWAWPTFNFADSAIVVGIGIFLYLSLFTKKLEAPADQPTSQALTDPPEPATSASSALRTDSEQ